MGVLEFAKRSIVISSATHSLRNPPEVAMSILMSYKQQCRQVGLEFAEKPRNTYMKHRRRIESKLSVCMSAFDLLEKYQMSRLFHQG